MENPFIGEWNDQEGKEVNIAGTEGNVTVVFGSGRGPFQGFYLNLAAPVINVNFTDDSQFTGVLVTKGDDKCIEWSNGNSWQQNDAC